MVENPETKVANESADKIFKELKENNDAPEQVWKMIEKGVSLIGNVEYSMDKRQGDGRDNPKFLDCSSFTAWTFHKLGMTNVPYYSSTTTFLSSDKFKTINGTDLKPGDIGLKGFQLAKPVKLTIKDTAEVQTVTVKDKPIPDIPDTPQTDGKTPIIPITLAIIAAVGGAILVFKKEK